MKRWHLHVLAGQGHVIPHKRKADQSEEEGSKPRDTHWREGPLLPGSTVDTWWPKKALHGRETDVLLMTQETEALAPQEASWSVPECVLLLRTNKW